MPWRKITTTLRHRRVHSLEVKISQRPGHLKPSIDQRTSAGCDRSVGTLDPFTFRRKVGCVVHAEWDRTRYDTRVFVARIQHRPRITRVGAHDPVGGYQDDGSSRARFGRGCDNGYGWGWRGVVAVILRWVCGWCWFVRIVGHILRAQGGEQFIIEVHERSLQSVSNQIDARCLASVGVGVGVSRSLGIPCTTTGVVVLPSRGFGTAVRVRVPGGWCRCGCPNQCDIPLEGVLLFKDTQQILVRKLGRERSPVSIKDTEQIMRKRQLVFHRDCIIRCRYDAYGFDGMAMIGVFHGCSPALHTRRTPR
mmetsp:Transcript_29301/g.35689  ORF Transcript_29301/g.35689 Transcript_29301/m.35689 type:complete len:307 (-) Transcript_29301:159-1079(-)